MIRWRRHGSRLRSGSRPLLAHLGRSWITAHPGRQPAKITAITLASKLLLVMFLCSGREWRGENASNVKWIREDRSRARNSNPG
jgi:hypothetical protein